MSYVIHKKPQNQTNQYKLIWGRNNDQHQQQCCNNQNFLFDKKDNKKAESECMLNLVSTKENRCFSNHDNTRRLIDVISCQLANEGIKNPLTYADINAIVQSQYLDYCYYNAGPDTDNDYVRLVNSILQTRGTDNIWQLRKNKNYILTKRGQPFLYRTNNMWVRSVYSPRREEISAVPEGVSLRLRGGDNSDGGEEDTSSTDEKADTRNRPESVLYPDFYAFLRSRMMNYRNQTTTSATAANKSGEINTTQKHETSASPTSTASEKQPEIYDQSPTIAHISEAPSTSDSVRSPQINNDTDQDIILSTSSIQPRIENTLENSDHCDTSRDPLPSADASIITKTRTSLEKLGSPVRDEPHHISNANTNCTRMVELHQHRYIHIHRLNRHHHHAIGIHEANRDTSCRNHSATPRRIIWLRRSPTVRYITRYRTAGLGHSPRAQRNVEQSKHYGVAPNIVDTNLSPSDGPRRVGYSLTTTYTTALYEIVAPWYNTLYNTFSGVATVNTEYTSTYYNTIDGQPRSYRESYENVSPISYHSASRSRSSDELESNVPVEGIRSCGQYAGGSKTSSREKNISTSPLPNKIQLDRLDRAGDDTATAIVPQQAGRSRETSGGEQILVKSERGQVPNVTQKYNIRGAKTSRGAKSGDKRSRRIKESSDSEYPLTSSSMLKGDTDDLLDTSESDVKRSSLLDTVKQKLNLKETFSEKSMEDQRIEPYKTASSKTKKDKTGQTKKKSFNINRDPLTEEMKNFILHDDIYGFVRSYMASDQLQTPAGQSIRAKEETMGQSKQFTTPRDSPSMAERDLEKLEKPAGQSSTTTGNRMGSDRSDKSIQPVTPRGAATNILQQESSMESLIEKNISESNKKASSPSMTERELEKVQGSVAKPARTKERKMDPYRSGQFKQPATPRGAAINNLRQERSLESSKRNNILARNGRVSSSSKAERAGLSQHDATAAPTVKNTIDDQGVSTTMKSTAIDYTSTKPYLQDSIDTVDTRDNSLTKKNETSHSLPKSEGLIDVSAHYERPVTLEKIPNKPKSNILSLAVSKIGTINRDPLTDKMKASVLKGDFNGFIQSYMSATRTVPQSPKMVDKQDRVPPPSSTGRSNEIKTLDSEITSSSTPTTGTNESNETSAFDGTVETFDSVDAGESSSSGWFYDSRTEISVSSGSNTRPSILENVKQKFGLGATSVDETSAKASRENPDRIATNGQPEYIPEGAGDNYNVPPPSGKNVDQIGLVTSSSGSADSGDEKKDSDLHENIYAALNSLVDDYRNSPTRLDQKEPPEREAQSNGVTPDSTSPVEEMEPIEINFAGPSSDSTSQKRATVSYSEYTLDGVGINQAADDSMQNYLRYQETISAGNNDENDVPEASEAVSADPIVTDNSRKLVLETETTLLASDESRPSILDSIKQRLGFGSTSDAAMLPPATPSTGTTTVTSETHPIIVSTGTPSGTPGKSEREPSNAISIEASPTTDVARSSVLDSIKQRLGFGSTSDAMLPAATSSAATTTVTSETHPIIVSAGTPSGTPGKSDREPSDAISTEASPTTDVARSSVLDSIKQRLGYGSTSDAAILPVATSSAGTPTVTSELPPIAVSAGSPSGTPAKSEKEPSVAISTEASPTTDVARSSVLDSIKQRLGYGSTLDAMLPAATSSAGTTTVTSETHPNAVSIPTTDIIRPSLLDSVKAGLGIETSSTAPGPSIPPATSAQHTDAIAVDTQTTTNNARSSILDNVKEKFGYGKGPVGTVDSPPGSVPVSTSPNLIEPSTTTRPQRPSNLEIIKNKFGYGKIPEESSSTPAAPSVAVPARSSISTVLTTPHSAHNIPRSSEKLIEFVRTDDVANFRTGSFAVPASARSQPGGENETNTFWEYARWITDFWNAPMTSSDSQSDDNNASPSLWNSFKERLGYGETSGATSLSSDSTPVSKPAGPGSAGTTDSSSGESHQDMSGSPTSSTESNTIWGSMYDYARWMFGYPTPDTTQPTDFTDTSSLWNSFKTRLGYGEPSSASPLSSDSTPASRTSGVSPLSSDSTPASRISGDSPLSSDTTPASKPAAPGSAGTRVSSSEESFPEMSGSPTSSTESNTIWGSMYDYARWMFGYPTPDTTQPTDVTDNPSLWNSFKTRLGYGEPSSATPLSSDSTPASRTSGVSPLSSDSTPVSRTSGVSTLSSNTTPASKPDGPGSAETRDSSSAESFPEMSGSPTSSTESNTIWGSMYDYARWMFGYPTPVTTQPTDVTDNPSLWNSFKTRLGYGEPSFATPLSSDSTPASRTSGVSSLSSNTTPASKPDGPGSAETRDSSSAESFPEMSGSPTTSTESNTIWGSMYDYARWMFGYPTPDTTHSTDVADTPTLWNSFKTRLGYGETSGAPPLSGPRSTGIRESLSVEFFPEISGSSTSSTESNTVWDSMYEFARWFFGYPPQDTTPRSDQDSRERLREFDPNRSENEPTHSRTERPRSILSTGKRSSGSKSVKFDEEISASKSDLTETSEPDLGKDDSLSDSGSHKKKGHLFYKIIAVKDSIDSIHVEVSEESIEVVAPPETETAGRAKKR